MLCLPVEGSVVSMIEQMEQQCHLTKKQIFLSQDSCSQKCTTWHYFTPCTIECGSIHGSSAVSGWCHV